MQPSPERAPFAAVILAAGAASRMGSNKMLLEVGGEPMARRAARVALEGGLDPVVVVVGRDADRVRGALAGLPCHFVHNPDFAGPTSSSLHRGIGALPPEAEGIVVLLGDMVRVGPDMVAALVEAAERDGAPLAASQYGDVVAPPLLFRRSLFPDLLACHGDGCGRSVLRTHRDRAAIVPAPPGALADVDTPAELDAARAESGPGNV